MVGEFLIRFECAIAVARNLPVNEQPEHSIERIGCWVPVWIAVFKMLGGERDADHRSTETRSIS
jgi:hypothetical protein